MTGNRQSAKESFFDSSWIIRLTNSALFSRNARQIYEGNYALSSLFCKPNHSPRTLVSLPLLFSLFSFYSHFAAPPPNVFSRSLPEFFVSPSSDKCSIRYFSDNAFDRGGSIFLESNLDR